MTMMPHDKDSPEPAACTVLVVDDTAVNLEVAVAVLERADYQVRVARDGEEGVQRARQLVPDLILLDVIMPGIDGFETCRRLKAAPETRDIPVIFASALADSDNKLAGFEAGGVDYVTKPFQFDELLARVRTHISLCRTQKELAAKSRELQESEARYRGLFEAATDGILLFDFATGRISEVNAALAAMLGCDCRTLLGEKFWEVGLFRGQPQCRAAMAELPRLGRVRFEHLRLPRQGGTQLDVEVVANLYPVAGARAVQCNVRDITARKRAEEMQKHLELELRQAQKLESVGRLASGVAHEINTPVQFVNDSCHYVRNSLQDLAGVLLLYRGTLQQLAAGKCEPQAALAKLAAAEAAADLDYALESMPAAMDRALEGLQRVADIVRSMKEFAHPSSKEKAYADINKAILGTITIARNEYKYVADVKTELDDIPEVCCYLSDLNQVILNILVNAAHAIEDAHGGNDNRGLITVRTRREGDSVEISIADTGGGIPDAIRDKIFDPFFTTKEVGRGTGQGLAIARSVVDRHGGELRFDSRIGEGTTFFIRLPIEPEPAAAGEEAA